ncbi:hypothetical protein [Rhodovulum sp. PH10]|uniref:hypothetical protein n=1 Tax=Rhodovulum sp. PH10 TaxID=1187851 RepID=UPI00058CE809|nr:hypothetical protein [Rhodovulum sp. PH10]
MSDDGWGQIVAEIIRNYPPQWTLAIVAAGMLVWRLPDIVREIFTGAREHRRIEAEIERKRLLAARSLKKKKERLEKKRQRDPPG